MGDIITKRITRTLKVFEADPIIQSSNVEYNHTTTDESNYSMEWRMFLPDLGLLIRPAKPGEYLNKKYTSHIKYCRHDLQLSMLVVNTGIQHLVKPYLSGILEYFKYAQGAHINISGPNSLLKVLDWLDLPIINKIQTK